MLLTALLQHDRGSRPSRDVHVHSSVFNSGPMSASGNSMGCLSAVSGYTPPDRFEAFMTTINGKLDGLSAQVRTQPAHPWPPRML